MQDLLEEQFLEEQVPEEQLSEEQAVKEQVLKKQRLKGQVSEEQAVKEAYGTQSERTRGLRHAVGADLRRRRRSGPEARASVQLGTRLGSARHAASVQLGPRSHGVQDLAAHRTALLHGWGTCGPGEPTSVVEQSR